MTPSLTTTDLFHRYRGGFSLGPVNLSLGPGLHYLQGPNGSGKTTLMRCLCGAMRPTGGTIQICGRDPIDDHHARRFVAWLPAEIDLPDFFSVDEAWQSVAALRDAPDWNGDTRRDALGLPGKLRLSAASAGQRKKVGWLSTLAGDPQVLLLDEPFANLDQEAAHTVAGWLEAFRTERVILLTAHTPPPIAPDTTNALRPGQPLTAQG